jgi:hypothetical protein
MECALVAKLADGPEWTYEVKLDGCRSIGVKTSLDGMDGGRSAAPFQICGTAGRQESATSQ